MFFQNIVFSNLFSYISYLPHVLLFSYYFGTIPLVVGEGRGGDKIYGFIHILSPKICFLYDTKSDNYFQNKLSYFRSLTHCDWLLELNKIPSNLLLSPKDFVACRGRHVAGLK